MYTSTHEMTQPVHMIITIKTGLINGISFKRCSITSVINFVRYLIQHDVANDCIIIAWTTSTTILWLLVTSLGDTKL